MTDRSAHYTLLGYLYQFDKTIIELISLAKNSDRLAIEGIEDIDVADMGGAKAIQCKYYSAQTYYPSKLREPISAMLEHFINATGQTSFTYHLYLYFGDFRAMPAALTLAELKCILTYTPKGKPTVKVYSDLGATDRQLSEFLACVSIERAMHFDAQHARVLDLLKAQLNCEKLDAEAFFYNNALRFVFDKAIKPSLADRTVTKKNFLTAIDSKQLTLSRWLLELKGRDEFFKLIRKQLNQRKCLQSQRNKGILLSTKLLSDAKYTFRRFCQDIIAEYYNKGHQRIDAMPWTLVLDVSVDEVKKYKKELLAADVFFTDGYEHVNFAPTMFNRRPIKTKVVQPGTGKATDQLADSSYFLKVLTADTYRKHRKAIQPLDVFFCESLIDVAKYFSAPNKIDVIYIDSVNSLADLAKLLTTK
jgi:hypothetical protein